MTSPLSTPLTLPGGAVLPNRIAKAAMSEGMADPANRSTPRLQALYGTWAESGAGLLLSGNIQVDRWHLERPGNVVLEDESGLAELRAMTAAATSGGAHFWAQLGHTGRQVESAINPEPLAPSCVEIDVMRGAGFSFAPPRAMTEAEIGHAIGQFAVSARLAKAAGFTGIQLHAAHGYLFSQFLSPLANRRGDRWGGPLENRARLLLETIAAVRAAVGAGFPIGVKLNASDFQKGGFTNADCLQLTDWLNDTTLDLLELSGGSLEQPKQVGVSVKDEGEDFRPPSTIAREAYFVSFAGAVRAVATMPVMVTGGFRGAAGMVGALEAGELDLVGIGRPFIADPRTGVRLLSGEIARAATPEDNIGLFHLLGWNNTQLERLGDGLAPDLALGGEEATKLFRAREAQVLARLLDQRGRRAA
ncbi:NADH:flavin oxidoreductase/NADH oxidase family protein [Phenylobacterium sp.]|uniref:NADH:flavin oxidoreductase/NADH oxidase family protein n=1 Tax=Phenylobacterium sp. TaxID=1871053 RepID=UPI003BAC50CE